MLRVAVIFGLAMISLAANAADYPAAKEGDWVARDDAEKYFIILPDAIGHGNSTKPSDGLKTKFPQYNYADMVDAQYRLVAEGLGIKHVRMVIGNSMGGMNVWLWGEKYPGYMDVLVPMASQPTAMASRNWILRRMML
jgi:homoserine O-acetyltransferase/O-succinyltransferase